MIREQFALPAFVMGRRGRRAPNSRTQAGFARGLGRDEAAIPISPGARDKLKAKLPLSQADQKARIQQSKV